jgi:peptidoglycan DL-endopeptidase LytF
MVNAIDWRAEARRYAVPVLILLTATVGALVVRGALADDRAVPAEKPAPQVTKRTGVKRAAARLHIVSSGDTLGGIAERYDTTVARLQALNPTAEPQALRVGQELRVPTGDG